MNNAALEKITELAADERDAYRRVNGNLDLWRVRGDKDALTKALTEIETCKDLNDRSSLSVSYTHLRAHETVLDIVCRLLLEKK